MSKNLISPLLLCGSVLISSCEPATVTSKEGGQKTPASDNKAILAKNEASAKASTKGEAKASGKTTSAAQINDAASASPIQLLQNFTKPAALREQTAFDLESWKKARGQHLNLKNWMRYNPKPWTNYFSDSNTECTKAWYINLGPLGLRTLMHDRSWAGMPAIQAIVPKVLCDDKDLIFNNFEILEVKPGSPGEGKLKKGDLLLAIDGQALQSAQNTYIGETLDNRKVRGLEIHAGQLIDVAEGRGSVKLTVLRLSDEQKKQFTGLLKGARKWQEVASTKAETELSLDLPSGELLRISPSKGLQITDAWLTNAEGLKHRLIRSDKRKSSLNGTSVEIPAGKWTLKASLKSKGGSKSINVAVSKKIALPSKLRPYLKTIQLKLDRIGSFGKNFDPRGEKARNYAAMLAHRLAAQQGPDGSWQAKAYTSPSFYTSISALALMSTENSAYEGQISKAAKYVAAKGNSDKWTYVQGMNILFLSEYYLRTKDESILPSLKQLISRGRRYVLNDYTAGHGIGSPGYGGSGYIGGGGMLSMGFAAASHTPAMNADDKLVLDRMLERAQQIAPHGKIPYGRSGKSLETDPSPGQGDSCGTGPYFLASLMRGGVKNFTETAGKRYSNAPYGSGENGHATQTLHFCWAMLASANCSDEAYRASMNAYLWKFTTLREYDGFINQNNYRTEYHNGDGVVGPPYWRTAGYLLIMNAWKRNLATTGQPEYRSRKFLETARVFHRDAATHGYLKRNWSLVANVLGNKTPQSFKLAHAKLRSFAPDRKLGENLKKLLENDIKIAMHDILQAPAYAKEVSNGQLAELMLGLGFYASCSPATAEDEVEEGAKKLSKAEKGAAKKASKKEAKRIKKLIAAGKNPLLKYFVSLRPTSIAETLPEMEQSLPLQMKNLKISVIDSSRKYFTGTKSLDYGNFQAAAISKKAKKSGSFKSLQVPIEMKSGDKYSFKVSISYEILGEKISYTADLSNPSAIARSYEPQLTRVKVRGRLGLDYSDQYGLAIELANGDVIGCEHRAKLPKFLPSGALIEFEISPDSVWGHDVRSARLIEKNYRLMSYDAGKGISDFQALALQSAQVDKGIKISSAGKTLEVRLTEATEISSIYLEFDKSGKLNRSFSAYLFSDGQWHLVLQASKGGLHNLTSRKASSLRLVFDEGKSELALQQLFLIKPSKNTKPVADHWQ